MRRSMLILLLSVLLAGCGAQQPAAQPTASGAGAGRLVPIIAASELEVGRTRLPLGLLRNGAPVTDADLKLKLRLFYLGGGDSQVVQSETEAAYRGQGMPYALYVAYVDFDKPGAWGAEIEITSPNEPPQINRVRLDVIADSPIPSVGDAAVPSASLTARDVPSLDQLTSDAKPDPDLYQLSVADAIAAGKPFLLSFSTPGYCQTAVCAPNIYVIKQLKEKYKNTINFVHVEVYPYPFGESFEQRRQVPTLGEWKLKTEPWTFLVDGKGIIQARYEGGLALAELDPALAQLAAGQPVSAGP